MCGALRVKGPAALVIKRKMAPGIDRLEGSPHAHDVLKVRSRPST